MKHKRLTLTLFGTAALGLQACNNGSGTNSTQSTTTPQTQSCKFSANSLNINADTYAPTDKLSSIFSSCEFERSFEDAYPAEYADSPRANKGTAAYQYYSYANLEAAYEKLFPTLNSTNRPFSSGDYFNDMRELSAFLANIAQETNGSSAPMFNGGYQLTTPGALGVAYGLFASSEGSCKNDASCTSYGTKSNYCNVNFSGPSGSVGLCYGYGVDDTTVPFCKLAKEFCADPSVQAATNSSDTNNQYYGRGGKQLSYPYNYIYYGSIVNPNDKLDLAKNPNKLQENGELGWATALAFWAYPFPKTSPAGQDKPSMHEGFFTATNVGITDFDNLVGFGKTVNIINGGVECGKNRTYVPVTTLNRINSYLELLFLTNHKIPITKVEVTRDVNGAEVVDTYTRADILHNIARKGVAGAEIKFSSTDIPVDVTSATAPHIVKQFSRTENGVTNFIENSYMPLYKGSYMYNWGSYGRYNSQALIQEYYASPKTLTIKGSSAQYTDINKVMLYYDVNSQYNGKTNKIASERLDCAGVTNFDNQ